MSTDTDLSTEAVLLFSGNQIAREMLFPEFEAILDGFVPIPEFSGASVKGAYLVINPQLKVSAMALFLLDFDGKGLVDRRWNVPLQQMVSVAGKGPDMGAGAIRLACYSQCPIEWHQKKLWDPVMDQGSNTFALVKKSVEQNRMGLIFKKPAVEKAPAYSPTPTPQLSESQNIALQHKIHDHYNQELKTQIANLVKEQHLQLASLNSKQQETVQALEQEHQQRLSAYHEKIAALEAKVNDLENRNKSLKQNLEVQASKVEGIREYYSHKLEMAQKDESEQVRVVQENFALELEVKLQAATAELKEMLEMRDVELFYRHQNESGLKEEIVKLKADLQSALLQSSEQLLAKLKKAGINFVVYHPGVGQVTIEPEDLGSYLENSVGYLARITGVGEGLYSMWFEHYQHPECTALLESGRKCGNHLVRIGSPLQFHAGESDRCEHHQGLRLKTGADLH